MYSEKCTTSAEIKCVNCRRERWSSLQWEKWSVVSKEKQLDVSSDFDYSNLDWQRQRIISQRFITCDRSVCRECGIFLRAEIGVKSKNWNRVQVWPGGGVRAAAEFPATPAPDGRIPTFCIPLVLFFNFTF